MKKKLLIIGGIVAVALAPPAGLCELNWVQRALMRSSRRWKYGLLGLEEYFEFIVDLFKVAVGV